MTHRRDHRTTVTRHSLTVGCCANAADYDFCHRELWRLGHNEHAGNVARFGFASLAQYEDVSTNIAMIMSGIDPQTKKFAEPPEQIKNVIAALKADKSIQEAEKKEGLAQLEAALKNARPIQTVLPRARSAPA